MFDHVTIRVSDLKASERFYSRGLAALGAGTPTRGGHFVEWGDFSVAEARVDKPVTRRLHLAFVAQSRAEVDAWWRALTEEGYEDAGSPGPRPQYRYDYYGAVVLDPDGNSAEAVHHGGMTGEPAAIDHLWIRVRDLDASHRFYATIADIAGFAVRPLADRVQLHAPGGSFSVVEGEPTQNAHLAFPARDRSQVEEFHRVALAAGYRDNGGPGERPQYHVGYYGAFVLDPDGNNVESVFHDR